MAELNRLIEVLDRLGGSDLHIVAGGPPVMRIDGELRPLEAPALSSDDVLKLLARLGGRTVLARFESEKEFDFAAELPGGKRLRVNAFLTLRGPAAALRRIPDSLPSAAALGMPPSLLRLADLPRGLVLVTGATGSGKSTTLAALIDRINDSRACHVLTIEDPVEFVHASRRSLISHRELGTHTGSFAGALRSALREDPDVILVGEMRDRETIHLALTAAETGHLVFGTLHAATAARTVDRIIDVFPAGDKEQVRAMLAGSLQGVVSQLLLPRRGGGRVAAFEILVATPAVRNLIRENKIPQISSLIQIGSRFGMCTMKDSVTALVQGGAVAEADARGALLTSGAVDEQAAT